MTRLVKDTDVVHAHWIQVYDGNGDTYKYICSACSYFERDNFTRHYRYCPHCGARMDEGVKDDDRV